MKILTGLTEKTMGDVFFNGKDLNFNLEAIQLEIGYCPQFPLLFNELSVESNLLFYSRLKGIPRSMEYENVKRILKKVKLLSLGSNAIVSSLSGGMRQRLSLAVSLIGSPSVLLLDEPTSDLDPTSKRAIWDILSEIKEDKSIILTTHSLEEAEVLCNRIGIISHGQLQCLGTPSDMKTKFGSGYSLIVTFDSKLKQKVKDEIYKMIPKAIISKESSDIIIYKFSKNDIRLSDLFDQLKDMKELINDCSVSTSTLEDVYLNIINE